jgi:quercetin dioxygenase-like cupin family protein
MLDLLHFGPGHRRTDSPPNCPGMYPALIYHEDPVHVVELHFEPGGEMWEHSADHPILFITIHGKGRVRVDGEEAEIQAGQAVLWPAGKRHKAWAEESPLTAIVVEYDTPRSITG